MFNPQAFNILRMTIPLIVGIVIADYVRFSVPTLFWANLFVFSVFTSIVVRNKEKLCSLMIITTMMLLGALLISLDWQKKQVQIPDYPIAYKAVVSSTPIKKYDRWTCDLLTYGDIGEYKLKANIYTAKPIKLGDCLDCSSYWHEPKNYNTGSNFDYAMYLKRHNYAATTFISERKIKAITQEHSTWQIKIQLFREKLVNILRYNSQDDNSHNNNSHNDNSHNNDNSLQNDVSQDFAIIPAMVLGEKAFLSQETKDMYADAGASHVLALSGLHLGIFIYIISTLLFFFNRKAVLMIELLFVWSFVLLTGMPVSIIRAASMFSAYFIANYIGQRSNSYNTLSLAAFIILLFSPQSLYNIGFQLSFAAVIGIVAMSSTFKVTKLTALFLVPIAAQISTLPLILYHFGQFPTYFLIANIFITYLAGTILSLSLLMLIFSFCAQLFSLFAPAVSLLHSLLNITASLTNNYIHFVASLPHSTIEDIYINTPQLVLLYMLIAAFWFPIRQLKQKFHKKSLAAY